MHWIAAVKFIIFSGRIPLPSLMFKLSHLQMMFKHGEKKPEYLKLRNQSLTQVILQLSLLSILQAKGLFLALF